MKFLKILSFETFPDAEFMSSLLNEELEKKYKFILEKMFPLGGGEDMTPFVGMWEPGGARPVDRCRAAVLPTPGKIFPARTWHHLLECESLGGLDPLTGAGLQCCQRLASVFRRGHATTW